MIDIVCIGTTKAIGDSVGPLVGTALHSLLKDYDVNIIGTVDDQVNGATLFEKLKEVRQGSTIIAVDAAITTDNSLIGTYERIEGSLHPGAGIDKVTTDIGNISYKAYVMSADVPEYMIMFVDKDLIHKLVQAITTDIVELVTTGSDLINNKINIYNI